MTIAQPSDFVWPFVGAGGIGYSLSGFIFLSRGPVSHCLEYLHWEFLVAEMQYKEEEGCWFLIRQELK